MGIVNDIKGTFQQLVEATDNLKMAIAQAKVIAAHAYQLPLVPAETKEFPNYENRIIEVKHIAREFTALTAANRCYSRFYFEADTSKKSPFRCPGIIQLGVSHTTTISAAVKNVNDLKDKLKTMVNAKDVITEKPLYDRFEKFEIIRQAIPGAVTLQVYRNIVCIDDPVRSVGFTWANKQSIKTIKLDELQQIIEENKRAIPTGVTENEWKARMDQEIKTINESKATLFKIRRPVPANPMANIRLQSSTNLMRHAHMPIIVFGDEPIKISHLKSYNPDVKRYREKITIDSYLLERMHILPIKK